VKGENYLMNPGEIAEDVWYVMNKKNRAINKIITRSLTQEF